MLDIISKANKLYLKFYKNQYAKQNSVAWNDVDTIPRLYGYKNQVRNKDVVISAEDVQHFKKELEDLNEKNDIVVSVPDSSRIVIADEDDILQLQNGIVLFGWPSCPWFRNAVGPLLEFSAEEKATIYYLNIKDIRDFKELQDDEVVTTEEGSAGYRAILEKFHDILNPYKALGID